MIDTDLYRSFNIDRYRVSHKPRNIQTYLCYTAIYPTSTYYHNLVEIAEKEWRRHIHTHLRGHSIKHILQQSLGMLCNVRDAQYYYYNNSFAHKWVFLGHSIECRNSVAIIVSKTVYEKSTLSAYQSSIYFHNYPYFPKNGWHLVRVAGNW